MPNATRRSATGELASAVETTEGKVVKLKSAGIKASAAKAG